LWREFFSFDFGPLQSRYGFGGRPFEARLFVVEPIVKSPATSTSSWTGASVASAAAASAGANGNAYAAVFYSPLSNWDTGKM